MPPPIMRRMRDPSSLGGATVLCLGAAAGASRSVLRSANLGNTNQAETIFSGAMMPDNSIHP